MRMATVCTVFSAENENQITEEIKLTSNYVSTKLRGQINKRRKLIESTLRKKERVSWMKLNKYYKVKDDESTREYRCNTKIKIEPC